MPAAKTAQIMPHRIRSPVILGAGRDGSEFLVRMRPPSACTTVLACRLLGGGISSRQVLPPVKMIVSAAT